MSRICFVNSISVIILALLCSTVFGQAKTAAGDILRGQGKLAEGVGWYNFNTARANKINVQAMRNYNEEVRLNYAYRVKFWDEKKLGRKLSLEEAKKRAEAKMAQIRDNPSNDDIKSGEALNVLVSMLTDPDINPEAWDGKTVELQQTSVLKDLVFYHYPNKIAENEKKVLVALSRLGKEIEWPIFLNEPSLAAEREDYVQSVTKLKATVLDSKFDPEQRRTLDESLKKLANKIETLDDKGGFRTEGRRFYREKLAEATKLFDASNIDWSREILYDTERYDAKNTRQLIEFMRQYRLHFAEADSSRSNSLYNSLFASLKQQAVNLGCYRELSPRNAKQYDSSDESEEVDQFQVGNRWSGKGSYSKGVKPGEFSDPLWEFEITERKGREFEGFMTYYGTGVKKRIKLPVSGNAPKRANGPIKIEMADKKRQFQDYEGKYAENGNIHLRFSGRGAAGQPVEGSINLERVHAKRK